jgi:hypothetical protein
VIWFSEKFFWRGMSTFLVATTLLFGPSGAESSRPDSKKLPIQRSWRQLQWQAVRCGLALWSLESVSFVGSRIPGQLTIPPLERAIDRIEDRFIEIYRARELQGAFRQTLLKALASDDSRKALLELAITVELLESDHNRNFVHRKIFNQLRRIDILKLRQLVEQNEGALRKPVPLILGRLFLSFSQFESYVPLAASYREFADRVLRQAGFHSLVKYQERLLVLADRIKNLEIKRWMIDTHLYSLQIANAGQGESLFSGVEEERKESPDAMKKEESGEAAWVEFRRLYNVFGNGRQQQDIEAGLYKIFDRYRYIRVVIQALWDYQILAADPKEGFLDMQNSPIESLQELEDQVDMLETFVSYYFPHLSSQTPRAVNVVQESIGFQEPRLREYFSKQCVQKFDEAIQSQDLKTIEAVIAGEFIFLESFDPIFDLINGSAVSPELKSSVLKMITKYEWTKPE